MYSDSFLKIFFESFKESKLKAPTPEKDTNI
jgi:hypothetical protein